MSTSWPAPSLPVPSVPNVQPHTLTLDQYQELARQTDFTLTSSPDLHFPLFGLFGEVGSLLSEVKKKQREHASYIRYEDAVLEELGDAFWYFSTLASRLHLRISSLLDPATLPSAAGNREARSGRTPIAVLQSSNPRSGPSDPDSYRPIAMHLASTVGKLLAARLEEDTRSEDSAQSAHLSTILGLFFRLADATNVSLAHAAYLNLNKVLDRWPTTRVFPSLYDVDVPTEEQIPRQLEIRIQERTVADRTYVFLSCNGINIGDRLTDNIAIQDDYRFHDVFHLSYAAIIGWSPVIRALLRVKRKSQPHIDENEDGARAILIEEGISTWIFNYAKTLNYFVEHRTIDYSVLKAIRSLVAGYEVQSCPPWLWEEAILKGYDVFRQLRTYRGGVVVADLSARTISFRRISDDSR